LGVFLPKDSHLVKESRLRPALIQLAKRTLDLLPPDFKDRVKEFMRSVPLPGEKKQAEPMRES